MNQAATADRRVFAGGAAFVDGRFVLVAEARIPILDWGFLRSDATYDVAHVWPFAWTADPDKQEQRLHAVIGRVQRIQAGSVDPTVKNYHWLDLELGLYDAYDRGGETVILVDCEGNVVEGPGFNVFVVKDGRMSTPDRGVLEGITRKTVIELAAELGIPLEAREVPADEVRAADEGFFTSTAGGVIPVTTVDGGAVGAGEPRPVTLRLREAYWNLHQDPHFALSVRYD